MKQSRYHSQSWCIKWWCTFRLHGLRLARMRMRIPRAGNLGFAADLRCRAELAELAACSLIFAKLGTRYVETYSIR